MQEALQKNETTAVQSFDLSSGQIPNLHQAKEVPADLTSEYWTPDRNGEYKLVFYQTIEQSTYTDERTGEELDLPCAILLEQREDLSINPIRNGSKRLVAALEEAEKNGKIEKGTPLKITFLGKQKNKQNAYLSDRWSVRPLSL